ncbi:fimbria/pilus periplasmic chaperone [Serratia sp. (in: enterobacteria)]|uniref:fimbria/pilus periplasmic chaperone n=1 Tax=Serratia sp. (in: enterobacteria) TaxID=616 RepID=UPI003989DFC7
MQTIRKITLLTVLLLGSQAANSAIALDRTRVIYDGQSKSISLNISNENKELPYLAQAWIENSRHQKITTPLIVTPPVQRLEAGAKSAVRISATPEALTLPQDRESLFYFNLREIPPRSEKSNVMQIALQTQIKLFYRPQAVTPKKGEIWQQQIKLQQTAQGYRIDNPTPYHLTVIGLAEKSTAKTDDGFQPLMIAPKSTGELKSNHFSQPALTYINDYGGRPVLNFSCNAGHCQVVNAK